MMPSPINGPAHSVQLNRTFPAPVEKVFAAWTQPDQLVRWMAPAGWNPFAELDLRVGGRYRMGMTLPNGALICATGTYLEVSPPVRLVFTWNWEGEEGAETRVTVELRAVDGGTEVSLTHGGFPGAEAAQNHRQGWSDWMDRLEKLAPSL